MYLHSVLGLSPFALITHTFDSTLFALTALIIFALISVAPSPFCTHIFCTQLQFVSFSIFTLHSIYFWLHTFCTHYFCTHLWNKYLCSLFWHSALFALKFFTPLKMTILCCRRVFVCSLCWRDSRMESLITTIKVKYVAWKRTASSPASAARRRKLDNKRLQISSLPSGYLT